MSGCGALVAGTPQLLPGSVLQRLTYVTVLRTFGKYSYALYLFHGHSNRFFTRVVLNAEAGVAVGGTVLPWQMLCVIISSPASFAIAYASWHLYEKHFLRLKVFFPTRQRMLAPRYSTAETTAPAVLAEPEALSQASKQIEEKMSNQT